MAKLSDETARARVLSNFPGVEFLEPYPGSTKKWRMLCPQCGEVATPTGNTAMRGSQGICHPCGIRNQSARRVMSDETARAKVLTNYPGVKFLESYPGSKGKWKMLCPDCQAQVSPVASVAMNASQGICRPCGYRRFGDSKRLPESVAVASVPDFMQVLEPYSGCVTPWKMLCLRCNSEVSPTLLNISHGHDPCKYCGRRGAGYNMTTLTRDETLRWKPSHFYVRELVDDGRTLYKVGIGSIERARCGKGELISMDEAPVCVAWICEQAIISECGRTELREPLGSTGHTEIVDDFQVIQRHRKTLAAHVGHTKSRAGRLAYDAHHFSTHRD